MRDQTNSAVNAFHGRSAGLVTLILRARGAELAEVAVTMFIRSIHIARYMHKLHTHTHTHTHIYIYMCVCVCVCVYIYIYIYIHIHAGPSGRTV